MIPPRARAAIVAVALSLLALAPPVEAAREIDYLYIDGSEGGGSGGHAAIALGDRVFHFEHRAPGILRLAREPREVIRHRYGVLYNRTIRVSHVPVSDETYGLVLDELTRRYFVQRQHLADHEAAARERRLLEAARAQRQGTGHDAPMVLDGAGFFFDEVTVSSARDDAEQPQVAPALARLRARVLAAHGDDAIRRAIESRRAVLTALRPDADPEPSQPLALDRLAPGRHGFADRYRDDRLALLALDALDAARPLRPGSLAEDVLPVMSPEEIERVDLLADLLEASLVRLVQSRRPDWGFPLLLGMARLAALDESRRTGRWMVLDATPADAPVIRRERLQERPALARGLRARAEADFATARAHLLDRAASADAFPETALVALEAAGTRLAQIQGALAAGRDVRLPWGTPLPGRAAPVSEPLLPGLGAEDLDSALAAAREREAAQAGGLKRLYGYNLITRNCVTEIFRTIEAALRRDVLARDPALGGDTLDARVRAASEARLGGYVPPIGVLGFIPAVSSIAVDQGYAVSAVVDLPSYRTAQLEQMYAREHPLRVFLRESNTLTSTLYRRAPEDSTFLFFTDDAIAMRPLFGAANVLTGLGAAAAGLATLAVDGGDLLTSGLKGVFFSLPELAFFNIRKGSFPDLARRPLDVPETAAGPAALARDEADR